MQSRFRKLGRRGTAIGAQLVVTLLLTEVVLRLLVPFNESLRQLDYNPRWAGRLAGVSSLRELLARTHRGFRPFEDAGGFRTNADGLRTPEYFADKGSSYRVVTLGDSFTFAAKTSYGKHWPKLLEKRLREVFDLPAEVINLGYPGVGPRFELRMWQLEGSRLNADLVIQAFYVGNDFIDGLRMRIAPLSLSQLLLDYSTLYRITRNLYRHKTMAASAESTPGEAGEAGETGPRPRRAPRHDSGGFEIDGHKARSPERATFRPKRYNGIVARTMQVARISNRSRFEAAFRKGGQVLLETRQAVEATGARYVLMIIPSEFQVHPDVALGGMELKGTTLDEYEVDWPQKRFAAFCEENGLECLDVLPAFRESGRTRKLYWLRDTHWNVEGNALAAEHLVEYFRGAGL